MLEFVQDVSCSSSCLRLFLLLSSCLVSVRFFQVVFCRLYMSFTLSTCVLGSFSVVVGSIVLFSVSQASYIAYFVWLIF